MAIFKYSKEFQEEAHKYKIKDQEKVFADLIIMGYPPKDAFIASGLYQPSRGLKYNNDFLNDLLNYRLNLSRYLEDKMPKKEEDIEEDDVIEVEEKEECQDAVLKDKESAILELEALLPDLTGKDRADVIMKITDLRGWKKEMPKEEAELVHYFLPLTCNNCSLYLKAMKDKEDSR